MEEYYAGRDEFFTWLWEEKLTNEEREQYEREFEKEKNKFLSPDLRFEGPK